jgi:ADP-ribosylglycohydrolase
MASQEISRQDRFRGLLLGTAAGDALGLPAEGLSPRRARRLFGASWRHRFLGRRGMVSDDTEHSVFVAQCLLAHPDSPEAFARRLAMCLRWWLLSLPAGVGLATLRATLRLWLGASPQRSGVRSAGNGPAMRSAPIGAFFAAEPGRMEEYLAASTALTHTDPRALVGARAVARVSAWSIREGLCARPAPEKFLEVLRSAGEKDPEWLGLLEKLEEGLRRDLPVEQFARSLGLARGVTGYVYHTVPVALYAWHLHCGDFEATLGGVLDCGGDTDTTGAVAGALAGSVTGEGGIPAAWLRGILEWPRGLRVLRQVADRLAEAAREGRPGAPVSYFWPGALLRNVLFLAVVLAHGFRRLLPPY